MFANIGHAQVRVDDVDERPIITSGDELEHLGAFFRARPDYTAADVIEHLLSLSGRHAGQVASNGHAASNGNGSSPGHGVLNGSNETGHHSNGNGSGNGKGIADPAQVRSRVIA